MKLPLNYVQINGVSKKDPLALSGSKPDFAAINAITKSLLAMRQGLYCRKQFQRFK